MDDGNPSIVYDQVMEDIVASCPSKGKCPICRMNIDLFQVTPIVTLETSKDPIFEGITELNMFPFFGAIFESKNVSFQNSSFSFHFKSLEGSERPFIRFEDESQGQQHDQLFEPCFFFFPKSNTFHGKIDWTKVCV
jgi:hypothetical protein